MPNNPILLLNNIFKQAYSEMYEIGPIGEYYFGDLLDDCTVRSIYRTANENTKYKKLKFSQLLLRETTPFDDDPVKLMRLLIKYKAIYADR